jgi:hypothetical protein
MKTATVGTAIMIGMSTTTIVTTITTDFSLYPRLTNQPRVQTSPHCTLAFLFGLFPYLS